jgi:hypothetical protein
MGSYEDMVRIRNRKPVVKDYDYYERRIEFCEKGFMICMGVAFVAYAFAFIAKILGL